MKYKFLWNGIKDTETGKLYKCDYGCDIEEKGISSIIIIRENEDLPIIEDAIQYFNGNIGIDYRHELYQAVLMALYKRERHEKKIMNKRNKKK